MDLFQSSTWQIMPLTRGPEDNGELGARHILSSSDRTIEKPINRKAELLGCFQWVKKWQKVWSQKREEVWIKEKVWKELTEEDSPDTAPGLEKPKLVWNICLKSFLVSRMVGNPPSDTWFYLKVDFCIVSVTQSNRQTPAKPPPKEKMISLLIPCKQVLGSPREAVLSATFYITFPAKPRWSRRIWIQIRSRGKKIKFINFYKNLNQNRSHTEDIFKISLAIFRQR